MIFFIVFNAVGQAVRRLSGLYKYCSQKCASGTNLI